MDRCPVGVIHLVELVDETCTLVRKHKCAALERPFARDRVLAYTSGKTDCGRTLTSGEDRAMGCLLDIFEELRLGSTWVAEQ